MAPLSALFSVLPLLASFTLARPADRLPREVLTRAASAASNTGLDKNAVLGGFRDVGHSGVSAQMMFVGTPNTVYILDKSENNSMVVAAPDGSGSHPAYGTTYNLQTNVATPMWVESNTFCAGGMSLANGSWAVFGGNQAVGYNGDATNGKPGPYDDASGGQAIRLITPCDDMSCAWQQGTNELEMTAARWYPTVEPLGDGSLTIWGGDHLGGFVSDNGQNEPSFEYFPKSVGATANKVHLQFLVDTVPLNLFPLAWLMASGRMFLQAAYKTILYDFNADVEIPLPDMPYAVRVYPGSAAAVMLPLTPANNYTQSLLFCGGTAAKIENANPGGPGFNITAVPADNSCVRITPEAANPAYVDDDDLPEGRSMSSLIYLPDGTMWLGNGIGMGVAGYGLERLSTGVSYGQAPVYMPAIYDPSAPKGSRFSRTGLTKSPHERMYHSTAVLLADGAVLVSGSNPNPDVTFEQWGTSYSVEKWYPSWYSQTRPVPSGWPASLSYGGAAWDVSYVPAGNATAASPDNTKVVVIRTGFATHCMNFGQRYLELATSYTMDTGTGNVTLHVSQMPPNANIFQPGPAMIFLVVDGVPSVGQMIMIGSGDIETQPILAATRLPPSQTLNSVAVNTTTQSPTSTPSSSPSSGGSTSGAGSVSGGSDTDKKGSGALPTLSVSNWAAPLAAVLLGAVALL